MYNPDPYSPEGSYYECVECQYRAAGVEHLGSCPECSGAIRNLAVPRE